MHKCFISHKARVRNNASTIFREMLRLVLLLIAMHMSHVITYLVLQCVGGSRFLPQYIQYYTVASTYTMAGSYVYICILAG